jgi:hypothetical protein
MTGRRHHYLMIAELVCQNHQGPINTRLSSGTIVELRQTPGTTAAEPNEQGQQLLPHSGQAPGRTSSFFKARLLGAQEGIGDGDQADVMMPAQPLAAFVMVQPEFFFQFAIVLFDSPTRVGECQTTADEMDAAGCPSSAADPDASTER